MNQVKLIACGLILITNQAFAQCNVDATSLNNINSGNELQLIKDGLVTNPSNSSYYAYLDEAMADRKGIWACKSHLLLFDSVASKKGVPDGKILYSLALNESKKAGFPHPWTINVHGRGYYFKTREEAYYAAKWLVDHKINLFDIGIMQVNWRYHKTRFNSLWDAFQPTTNIEAASDILLENYKSTNDWALAVKWYHTGAALNKNKARANRGKLYFSRFIKHFESLKTES